LSIVAGVAADAPESVRTETADATRRTRLANERTFLAWWRTALTAFAVALGAGKLIPDLANKAERWPYALAGAGFAAIGVFLIAYGLRREREVTRALERGEFPPLADRVLVVLTVAGVLLGILTFALVVFSP
jgi:putative membrane protein